MPRRRPSVQIRPARAADLPALAALERTAMPDPWSQDSVAGELAQEDSLLLVACAADGGETPVAYASWRAAAGEAELLRLAVSGARRREGLATALLAAGDEALAALGCVACFLEVREDNAPAIGFYEASGFHRIGRRRGYYPPRPGDGLAGGRVDALIYARAVVAGGR